MSLLFIQKNYDLLFSAISKNKCINKYIYEFPICRIVHELIIYIIIPNT